jgi:hypothetical protein
MDGQPIPFSQFRALFPSVTVAKLSGHRWFCHKRTVHLEPSYVVDVCSSSWCHACPFREADSGAFHIPTIQEHRFHGETPTYHDVFSRRVS